MPFQSEAQRGKCYALKAKGKAGSWNCDEWSKATGDKKLPEHSKKASYSIPMSEFIKEASKAFNNNHIPIVSPTIKEGRITAPLVQDSIARRAAKTEKYQKSKTKTASIKWNLNLSEAHWAT